MRVLERSKGEAFFVEVHEDAEVRRSILESLREIVENLQRFEKFKEIRKDKLSQISKLSRIMKDINKLMPQLKNAMPDVKVRAAKPMETHKLAPKRKLESKGVAQEKPEVIKEKPASELQKLESELSEIEERLSSLK